MAKTGITALYAGVKRLFVSEEAVVDAAKITFNNLPTADPGVAGRLWVDAASARVVKVSAG